MILLIMSQMQKKQADSGVTVYSVVKVAVINFNNTTSTIVPGNVLFHI